MAEPLLVIACGALAREIDQLRKTRGWEHLHLKCIDAALHNHPAKIPDALREKIARYRDEYQHIYVAYADCGTGGAIDKILQEEGIERLPGVHCYQFFAGEQQFAALSEQEPGTFYLTDFLVRFFDRFIIEALKLEEHPELKPMYFGNYRRLVYLSQTEDSALLEEAQKAADYLGLEFLHVPTGYGLLESSLSDIVIKRDLHEKDSDLLA